ncbi:hypothetical protein SO802_014606 [Lithocarpus litseifolius]|uniref:Multiprotein bridging factor 1 N-terminal domain-containing protein n=1 Tax=Lithocarpus litseifolius TaxID=425828 RepID=A0AAW2CRE4_9ROSI
MKLLSDVANAKNYATCYSTVTYLGRCRSHPAADLTQPPSLCGVQERDRRSAVNQTLRIGAAVQTVKKAEASSNKKAAPVMNEKKLDVAVEPAALDRVSTEVKQLI